MSGTLPIHDCYVPSHRPPFDDTVSCRTNRRSREAGRRHLRVGAECNRCEPLWHLDTPCRETHMRPPPLGSSGSSRCSDSSHRQPSLRPAPYRAFGTANSRLCRKGRSENRTWPSQIQDPSESLLSSSPVRPVDAHPDCVVAHSRTLGIPQTPSTLGPSEEGMANRRRRHPRSQERHYLRLRSRSPN